MLTWYQWSSTLCSMNMRAISLNAPKVSCIPWLRHQMETFSTLLALCAFLWSAPDEMVEQTIVMPVIWDAIALVKLLELYLSEWKGNSLSSGRCDVICILEIYQIINNQSNFEKKIFCESVVNTVSLMVWYRYATTWLIEAAERRIYASVN